MMQFLTRILSKDNQEISYENLELKKELALLRIELEDQKKFLEQYSCALRNYALANEALCTEVAMIGKWVSQKIKEELSESTSFGTFGRGDTDDDEYLN